MKKTFVIILLALSSLCVRADVTLNIFAADLLTAGGSSMPIGGQVLLVASTTDLTFGEPDPNATLNVGSFLSANDLILFRGSLTSAGFFEQPVVLDLTLFAGNNLTTGDLLQWYWFPTLTAGSVNAPLGTTYGFYRDNGGIDGGDPWTLPSDNSVVSLVFATVSEGGSNPNAAGIASSVVPEASNFIFGGLAMGLVAFRLVPQIRRKFLVS